MESVRIAPYRHQLQVYPNPGSKQLISDGGSGKSTSNKHLPSNAPSNTRLSAAALTRKLLIRPLASSSPSSSAIEAVAVQKMVKAIRVHELGGPEVLKWEDVELGEPKEGEIRVKNEAIGLNFIDVYFRKGLYPAGPLPFTPGVEAVGKVVAVGPGLTGREIGDLVAYAGAPLGAYAEEQILPASAVIPVPPSIDPGIAASVLLKGMTAHCLVRHCFKVRVKEKGEVCCPGDARYEKQLTLQPIRHPTRPNHLSPVEPGHTVLIHAAAGGTGSLLCQWASALGATVIGTVSTKEKAEQAKKDGCHHVIISKEEDFVSRVSEITSGEGVEAVYDSIGKDTFEGSLACLKPRGHMVSFGQSSGIPDPVPLSALAAKSLFLTRPSVKHYTTTRDELLRAAGEVFTNVASGVLKVRVNHRYYLSQASRAHEDLENRRTSGSVLLIPDACN